MTDNYIFALIITSLLSLFFQSHLQKAAIKVGLVDKPNERKQHEGIVPLTGGLGIFLAFSFTVLLLDSSINNIRVFFSGAMILVIIGVLDDIHEIKASHRLVAQMLVGFIIFQFNNIQLLDFGEILIKGEVLELGAFSLPVTIIAVVGVINAFNMLDGIDGLAGSIALIILSMLSLFALYAGDISTFQLLGILSVAILVFLLFNWRFYHKKTALVFLGDSGSLFIGYVLAYFLIKLSQGDQRIITPVAALWIFAYPVIDTVTMMFRRMLKGHSPFDADREHFHHLLQMAGFSQHKTTSIIICINITCVLIGFLINSYHVAESYAFYVFIVLYVAYYLMIMRAWKVQRFLKRTFVINDAK